MKWFLSFLRSLFGYQPPLSLFEEPGAIGVSGVRADDIQLEAIAIAELEPDEPITDPPSSPPGAS